MTLAIGTSEREGEGGSEGGREGGRERGREEERASYLVPGVRLDLRKLKLGIIAVHGFDLLPCRRAQHLDDFNQLIHAAVAREQRVAQQQLRSHAAFAPDVDGGGVGRGPEN